MKNVSYFEIFLNKKNVSTNANVKADDNFSGNFAAKLQNCENMKFRYLRLSFIMFSGYIICEVSFIIFSGS